MVQNHVYSLRNVLHLHLLNIHQIDKWILISTEYIWFPITWHISGAMFRPGTTWPLQMGYFNPKLSSRQEMKARILELVQIFARNDLQHSYCLFQVQLKMGGW